MQVGSGGQVITLDQKYDRTANMSTQSSDFEAANKAIRDIILENEAVIQLENMTGLKGGLTLTLSIGVIPDRFDDMVEACKTIGILQSFSVTKVDKTDEYRALMAERATLEKTRDSYIALKQQGGDIKDLLLVEDKILQIETQLQSLSVDAGLYASENSFCTINISITETVEQTIDFNFIQSCALSALLWTLTVFASALFIVVAGLVISLVIVVVNGKIRQLRQKPPHMGKGEQPKPEEDEKAEGNAEA